MKRNIRWIRNRKEVILVSLFFFLFCFLIVLENIQITNLRYEIARQEEELKREKEAKAGLLIEIAKLSSPERIEKLATSYGLISVKPNQIVFLSDVLCEEKKKDVIFPGVGLFAKIFERSLEAKTK
ncbi:MAG: septum formation initiator family protein [bacterium]